MKNNIILSSIIFALVMLTVSCGPRLRNNPFDPGSAYNTNVNALYISAVSNISQLTANSVTVKWDRNIQADFYAYKIYGGTGTTVNTNGAPLVTITAQAVNEYTATGLLPFTQYHLAVMVENKSGYRVLSSTVSFRTPPATGDVITIKDPAVVEGNAKIYCISAINGYMFYGYRGCPSQYGGKGVGRIQNMVRMFYLPYWAYYDIDEADSLLIQYHSDYPQAGTNVWDLTYNTDWDTLNSSLDNGLGSVFYANVMGGADSYIYYSDPALGYLYVMTNTASNIMDINYSRKYYYSYTNGSWSNDAEYFWSPTNIYGRSGWVDLGSYYGVPKKFKVEYSGASDIIYFSTASYAGGRIYKATPSDYYTFSSSSIYFNSDIGYDDLTSFAADAQQLYIIQKTACVLRIVNIVSQQDVAIVGSAGSGFGQFNAPSDIDVYNGVVFVADTLNHRVQMFSTNGQFISSVGSFGQSFTQFDTPVALTVTSNSNSYSGAWDIYLLVADKTKVRYFNIDSLF